MQGAVSAESFFRNPFKESDFTVTDNNVRHLS